MRSLLLSSLTILLTSTAALAGSVTFENVPGTENYQVRNQLGQIQGTLERQYDPNARAYRFRDGSNGQLSDWKLEDKGGKTVLVPSPFRPHN